MSPAQENLRACLRQGNYGCCLPNWADAATELHPYGRIATNLHLSMGLPKQIIGFRVLGVLGFGYSRGNAFFWGVGGCLNVLRIMKLQCKQEAPTVPVGTSHNSAAETPEPQGVEINLGAMGSLIKVHLKDRHDKCKRQHTHRHVVSRAARILRVQHL